jgi:hypothetical protein
MLKTAVQRSRSERGAEAYPLGYVEDLSDARTKLAAVFSILSYLELRFIQTGVNSSSTKQVFMAAVLDQ